MKIETRPGTYFETYHKKEDFQTAVLKLIFTDKQPNMIFVGLTEDVPWKVKKQCFYSDLIFRKTSLRNKLLPKWDGLMMLTENPKWIIIYWVTKQSLEVPSINKDGTPRKKYKRKPKQIV